MGFRGGTGRGHSSLVAVMDLNFILLSICRLRLTWHNIDCGILKMIKGGFNKHWFLLIQTQNV